MRILQYIVSPVSSLARFTRITVACLLCCANSGAAAYDWQALGEGQVVIESVEDEQGVPGVRALFTVKASRDDIWATLIDYENFTQVFTGIDRMKVLDADAHGAKVEFWVDAVLMDLHYVLYRAYEMPGHRLTWKQVAGDLADIHGSWQILDTPDPESRLLIYESYVDIGFAVVTWLVREGAEDKTEEMGYRLRQWVESL